MVRKMANTKRKSAAVSKKPVAKKKAVPAKMPTAKASAVRKPVKAAKAPAPKKQAARQPAKAPQKKPAAKPVKKPVAAAKPVKAATKNVPVTTAKAVMPAKPAPQKTITTAKKGKMPAAASKETITREDGRYALPSTTVVDLPANYHPLAREEYMGPRQLAYFRAKLQKWREDLVEESKQTIDNLREEVRDVGDEAERATRETENWLELRPREGDGEVV